MMTERPTTYAILAEMVRLRRDGCRVERVDLHPATYADIRLENGADSPHLAPQMEHPKTLEGVPIRVTSEARPWRVVAGPPPRPFTPPAP